MKNSMKVFVACTDANGSADMFVATIDPTGLDCELGEHYDAAKEAAENNGYASPYICFDESEQVNIARQVAQLVCPIPFSLSDKSEDDDKEYAVEGHLEFGWDGVSVSLNGYSDSTSQDDKGTVAYLECWEKQVVLRAYADINSEMPTHFINLNGAKNEKRIDQ